MRGINAEVLLAETSEAYSEASNVRFISDNGSQFISKDFEELVVHLEFGHTLSSANHPQSNGKLERFNRTLKSEHVRRTAYINYKDACIIWRDGLRIITASSFTANRGTGFSISLN